MKPEQSELKKDILQKVAIIRSATNVVAHKISKDKLKVAEQWCAELNEQVKKLQKLCEEELE
jgi:hypothetical protein